MRIRNRLITVILALAIIPMVFVSYCIFNTAKRNLEENTFAKLDALTKTKVDMLETFFAERKSDLIVLQHRNVLKTTFPVLDQFSRDQYNPSYIEARETLDYQLHILQAVYEYANIILLNKDGEVIYASSPEHATTDLKKYMSSLDNAAFLKADRGVYIGDVLKTSCKEHPYIMVLAKALYDTEENKFMGSMCLAVDMGTIYKTICDNAGLGQSGETLLVKKTPDNKVLFLSPLKYEQEVVLRKQVTLGANIAIPSQNAASGKTGSGLSIDYLGEKILSVWRPIPSLGWGIVTKVDAKEAFGQIEKLKKIALVILIITIPLIMLTALTIAKSISDPIQRLHKGTEIIGDGNLDYKVGTDVKDEVGQLSRAFDTMTKNLKNTTTSIESLNKEVIERKQAEKNLETIFEASPIGMLLLNEKAEVTKINGVIEKLVGQYHLGDQPGNLLGCIHSFETPEGCGHSTSCSTCPIRNSVIKALSLNQSSHCAEVQTTFLIGGKEIHLWLEINTEPIVLNGSKYVIAAISNITNRKKAEDGLRKLSRAVEQNPACIVITDTEGNIEYVNPKFVELTGYTSQEVIGKNPRILKSGQTSLEEYKHMWDTIKSGHEWRGEFSNKKKNGELYFENASISPVVNEAGVITHFVAVKEDITAHKATETALKESEEKYKTLYESSYDAIMILTAEKGFMSGNPATIKLFGCKDEKEFTSLSPVDLSPKNQPDGADSLLKAQEMMKTAMEKGSHFFEWIHKRKDGTEFDATVLLTRIELKGEKVLQATVRDITVSKKAEKEMKEAVEMKSKFIATASHELRTPLTSIKEGINLVHSEMTGPLNDNQKEFLGIAKRNVDRLARLINDVLDYQKMTAGRMAFDLKSININETVRLVEEIMRPLVKEKGLELVIELDDAVPMAKFDKDKIIQVLTNLVNNALKFTEKGSIKITTSRHEDNIRVSIQDSGSGIKQEDISRLFQEFEQLGTDSDRKTGGTGLGLAISKKIIENHGGKIWAESDYGNGTTFYFELPMEAILCQIKS